MACLVGLIANPSWAQENMNLKPVESASSSGGAPDRWRGYLYQLKIEGYETVMGNKSPIKHAMGIRIFIGGKKIFAILNNPHGIDLDTKQYWKITEREERTPVSGKLHLVSVQKIPSFSPVSFDSFKTGMELQRLMPKQMEDKFYRLSEADKQLKIKDSKKMATIKGFPCNRWQYERGKMAGFKDVTGLGAKGEACMMDDPKYDVDVAALISIPNMFPSGLMDAMRIEDLFALIMKTSKMPASIRENSESTHGFGRVKTVRYLDLENVTEISTDELREKLSSEERGYFDQFMKQAPMNAVLLRDAQNNGQPMHVEVMAENMESNLRVSREPIASNSEKLTQEKGETAPATHVEYILYEGKAGDLRDWKQLKKGMGAREVENILGEPDRKDKTNETSFKYEGWIYPKGKVYFYKKKLSKWDSPTPKRVANSA